MFIQVTITHINPNTLGRFQTTPCKNCVKKTQSLQNKVIHCPTVDLFATKNLLYYLLYSQHKRKYNKAH